MSSAAPALLGVELDRTAFADEAIAACSRTIREHSKSFSMAARLLPQPARDEAVVLYAWCRYADDAVDEVPPAEAPAALARLERELDAIYAGAPQSDVVLAAFQALVQTRNIPRLYPQELVEGMRMDVEGQRYADSRTLYRYCYRVASTVGLMMCHVMGLRDARALQHAAHLGLAMQITNICRDVVEDWGRGRRYLPADRIEPHLIPAPAPEAEGSGFPSDAVEPFKWVVRALLDRAEYDYVSGDRGLIALPWRAALAVSAARLIYSDIGRVIARQGYDVTAGRAYTTKARKLALVGRAALGVMASLPRRWLLWVTGRGAMPPPTAELPFEQVALYEERVA